MTVGLRPPSVLRRLNLLVCRLPSVSPVTRGRKTASAPLFQSWQSAARYQKRAFEVETFPSRLRLYDGGPRSGDADCSSAHAFDLAASGDLVNEASPTCGPSRLRFFSRRQIRTGRIPRLPGASRAEEEIRASRRWSTCSGVLSPLTAWRDELVCRSRLDRRAVVLISQSRRGRCSARGPLARS